MGRQRLSAEQSQPVDVKRGRTMFESVDQTRQTIQIYCHVCNHAKEWRRSAHGQLVLLGQHHRRKLHSEMGEQDHVLHCVRLWLVHLSQRLSICHASSHTKTNSNTITLPSRISLTKQQQQQQQQKEQNKTKTKKYTHT